jgi:hypothetical protein
MLKRFIAYALRWQASTLILAPVIAWFNNSPNWFGSATDWQAAICANAIGASIFFWVDKFIFTSAAVEMWHVKEGKCDKCGKDTELWRLTLAPGYDKRTDEPKYLCMECSKEKTDKLRKRGVKIRGKSH